MKRIFVSLLAMTLVFSTSAVFAADMGVAYIKYNEATDTPILKGKKLLNWKAGKDTPSFIYGDLSTKTYSDVFSVKEFIKENTKTFKLNPAKDLTLMETTTDEVGMTHYRFIQSVKGVPIEGAEFFVHTDKDGYVKAVNGNLVTSAKQFKMPKQKVSEAKAIQNAWSHINLSKEDTIVESHGPSVHGNHVENTAEKSKLVVYEHEGKFYLTHKVQLQFIEPYGANWQVFVDATNGEIVDSFNAVTHGATSGYGYGVLGDYKTLNTYYYNGWYYLYDVTKPMNGVIETRDANNGTTQGGYSVDSNNAFTSSGQAADVDAHKYAGIVYDYYYNTHNRNSFDNAGSTIISTVHYSTNYNNAFWNGNQMVYGDGDGTTFIALSGALDVVAHELTHAVTERTAGLIYQDQSGALNESMSDVFGYFVEPNDYLMGEDVYTPGISGDALRSISDPTAYGQPDHMNDYYYTSSDNGGVHTNSGIPNKAAYNTIVSIGKTKAEKIYYRALTVYLTSSSDFSDARAALLSSTADLYGYGTEYTAVENAWDAVGVY
ncbi:peptidase M4 [Lottiidibacillus patelloidae]|uniref:Neutral metalloproteinase n=1 Tax=Lottiidibacillus patelloidae TaxID=2670334 RepID=A0A263BS72_9BACI|nr:M4 family metallopeptidase [Lottiidibacillus patelloidae]OZM56217.1 peptidase M4 [Lottiidibacillus patelloidae]